MLICALFCAGCDLFDDKPEIDLLAAIEEEIAWANSQKLTVTVKHPLDWGRSPQEGTGNCRDSVRDTELPRMDYPFEVDFNLGAGYGFSGWKVFYSEDYAGDELPDENLALAGELVDIVQSISATGSRSAKITVKTAQPVTIVPWCEERPRIAFANPPLINSGASYPVGTRIEITFASALNPETVKFGSGFIEIRGEHSPVNTSDPKMGQPYEDEATSGEEAGDLTGSRENTGKYFYDPVYDMAYNKIIINAGDGNNGTRAQPQNAAVTVVIGAGVLSANGNGMNAPAQIAFRIGDQVQLKQYYAQNVWGIHDDTGNKTEEDFFYNSDASKNRERRLSNSGTAAAPIYTVNLYFRSLVTNSEMTSAPTAVRVAELHYADLEGNLTYNDWPANPEYSTYSGGTLLEMSSGGSTAGQAYRSVNNGSDPNRIDYYKITHTMRAAESGVYRIAVMPYGGSYNPQGPASAAYITVAIDKDAPAGTPLLNFTSSGTNSYASMTPSANPLLNTYVYGTNNTSLAFTADLSGVQDNSGGGVLQNRTSADRPYTMDGSANLRWQWQLVGGNTTSKYPTDTELNAAAPAGDAAWLEMESHEETPLVVSNLLSKIGSSQTNGGLYLRYKDSKGNVSGWQQAARIKYYEDNLSDISGWTATVNSAGNAINVSWTNPSALSTDFTRAEMSYSVNNGPPQSANVTNATSKGETASAAISVPVINTSGVQSGSPVTGVNRYDITITVRSESNAYANTFSIWNIPDMSVSKLYPAETISTKEQLAAMAVNNVNKNYVLVNDITVTSHVPIGTGSGTAAFSGKFYGNGHTVTIQNFAASSVDMGLFGVANNALIRDLTVYYQTGVINFSGAESRFGGIAGTVTGTAQLLNVLAAGNVSVNMGTDNTFFVGGIAGQMTGTARVGNAADTAKAYASSSLALTVNKNIASPPATYTGSVYVGGIAGSIGTEISRETSGSAVSVEEATVTGNITIGSTSAVSAAVIIIGNSGEGLFYRGLFAGGLVGMINGSADAEASRAKLKNAVYRNGMISITNGTGAVMVGGAVGGVYKYANITSCAALAGGFETAKTGKGDRFFIGGFLGVFDSYGTVQNCYTENPVVLNNSEAINSVYAGGFCGYLYTAEIKYCYATGSVSALAQSPAADYTSLNAGGFAGYAVNVSYCYAKGNVNVVNQSTVSQSSSSYVFVGGFTGYSAPVNEGDKIANCYALGNVFVNNFSTDIFVGGFIGFRGPIGAIDRCFAAGSVIVQHLNNQSTGLHVGGLLGNEGNVSNSAVLGTGFFNEYAAWGPVIIATGDVKTDYESNKGIARFYGGTIYTSGNFSNNHAFYGIKVYRTDPFSAGAPESITSDSGGRDGADASSGDFRRRTFWKNAPDAASPGLGFTDADWIFSTVEDKGRPILRGSLNGPAMGGQN